MTRTRTRTRTKISGCKSKPFHDQMKMKTKKKTKRSTWRRSRSPTCNNSSNSSRKRKPKYLSLLQLQELSSSSDKKSHRRQSGGSTLTNFQEKDNQQQLINLFPLHPENLVKAEKDDQIISCPHDDDNNMAYLFDDGGATSLTGLLGAAINPCNINSPGDAEERDEESPSRTTSEAKEMSESYWRDQMLVRAALRNYKDRDDAPVYVRYSQVVDTRFTDHEEATSSSSSSNYCPTKYTNHHLKMPKVVQQHHHHQRKKLSLKLDYEVILNAWSDKGRPPFIGDQYASPQTVPDLHHIHSPPSDFLLTAALPQEIGNNMNGMWSVPELMLVKEEEEEEDIIGNCRNMEVAKEEIDEEEMEQRKNRRASVLRYKEKRHNRLFSKRIRYEVRKLNAEKRPRSKGRFVKLN